MVSKVNNDCNMAIWYPIVQSALFLSNKHSVVVLKNLWWPNKRWIIRFLYLCHRLNSTHTHTHTPRVLQKLTTHIEHISKLFLSCLYSADAISGTHSHLCHGESVDVIHVSNTHHLCVVTLRAIINHRGCRRWSQQASSQFIFHGIKCPDVTAKQGSRFVILHSS